METKTGEQNQIAMDLECPSGVCGRTMEKQDLSQSSPEYRWCGTWYNCTNAGCNCSILIPSKELQKHLEEQKGDE